MLGISTDDLKTQGEFAASLGIDYPMLSDASGEISRAYDVAWPFLGVAQRVTFVIDEGGQVRAAFRHEIRIGQHVEKAIAAIRQLRQGSRTTATD